MMFKKNFIAVVKHDGKILREKDGTVFLPFGAEYSLLFKNQESRRARVNITIDGEDALNGHNLVIKENSEGYLEGFLNKSGNGVRNKFKFIQKTEKIVNHRGDNIDDGSIRIEYKFEKPKPEVIDVTYDYYVPPRPVPPRRRKDDWPFTYPYYYKTTWANSDGFGGSSQCCSNSLGASSDNENVMHFMNTDDIPEITPDEGITVRGSISDQTLRTTSLGEMETNSHVIVLNLRGTTSTGVQVERPVTVKTKLVCTTCGTKNKSTHNCCCDCGASLI